MGVKFDRSVNSPRLCAPDDGYDDDGDDGDDDAGATDGVVQAAAQYLAAISPSSLLQLLCCVNAVATAGILFTKLINRFICAGVPVGEATQARQRERIGIGIGMGMAIGIRWWMRAPCEV